MNKALALITFALMISRAASAAPAWDLPDPRDVRLGGELGRAYDRGVARLGEDPYKSVVFLRSDVSFETERWFTNYSGDISGRFIEVASLTSPRGSMQPAALSELLGSILTYQKPDGHFGTEVDWKQPFDSVKVKAPKMLPIFWGNARLLVGLLTAYEAFGEAKYLEAAKKMGDFYIASAGDLMNPAREADYRATGTYAPAYITCYFPGIEGLARLYLATKDERYLKQAEAMAEFMKRFDTLPLNHSHGNLIAYHGILMLHQITGKAEYLKRAIARWDEAVGGGYIWPTGGVGEAFKPAFKRDEGCSQADWLRFNLDLWQATGEARYLDLAERLLRNHYAMNMTGNGGYGHHEFIIDETGPLLMQPKFVEAVWCCTFHGLMGLNFFKSYAIAGSDRGVFVNFPVNAQAPVKAAGRKGKVTVSAKEDAARRAMTCIVKFEVKDNKKGTPAFFIRVPDWADDAQVTDPITVREVPVSREGGYLKTTQPLANYGLKIVFTWSPRAEDRRLHRVELKPAQEARQVVLFDGPRLLMAKADKPLPAIKLNADQQGKWVPDKSNGYLKTWPDVDRTAGSAFVFNATVEK